MQFPGGITRKVRAYFILLLVTYGVLGVAGIPWYWFTQIALWAAINFYQRILVEIVVHHAIAFAASLWALAVFRRALASPAPASHSA